MKSSELYALLIVVAFSTMPLAPVMAQSGMPEQNGADRGPSRVVSEKPLSGHVEFGKI